MTERRSLFCTTALAARIECAEADLMARCCSAATRWDGLAFVRPIAGGMATFAEPGSPFNKVAGLGFGGVPSTGELEALERAFAERATPVQVEVAHLGDPEVMALLTGRGYRLVSFENVLGLALDQVSSPAEPAAIDVRRSGEDELEAWLDVVSDGFAHPDDQGVPSHEDFARDVLGRAVRDLAAAGALRFAAWRGGVLAGGASLRLANGIAQFAGAATGPAHRRRGVQTALLTARLREASRAGCDVAVITTQPGSKSQENAQRRGFDLLYTRAVLVRS